MNKEALKAVLKAWLVAGLIVLWVIVATQCYGPGWSPYFALFVMVFPFAVFISITVYQTSLEEQRKRALKRRNSDYFRL